MTTRTRSPGGERSAAGRDQTPQRRGAGGAGQRLEVSSGDSEQSMGPGEEQRERLMRCEGHGFPRGSEKVGRHYTPQGADGGRAAGPKGRGLPSSVGGTSRP